jgi:Actin
VKSIFFFLSNALPLYVTGLDTGLIVDCGFQSVQILPIVRSRICTEAFEVSYSACGVQIEKRLNENVFTDNQ